MAQQRLTQKLAVAVYLDELKRGKHGAFKRAAARMNLSVKTVQGRWYRYMASFGWQGENRRRRSGRTSRARFAQLSTWGGDL